MNGDSRGKDRGIAKEERVHFLMAGWLIAGDQRQDYRKKSCKPGLLGKVQEQTQALKLEGSRGGGKNRAHTLESDSIKNV